LTENKDVLIIGAGISGITVALELAQLGLSPALVEREASIGGLSASLCCKASESCNKCFACIVDRRISEVQQHQDISIFTQTELMGVKGCPGDYHLSLKKNKESFERTASAVVIAAGVDPYDASQKQEYGYRRHKNVMTAKDLDEMLRYRGELARPSDGRLPKKIAFFQCVGSRDESIGNLYCSHICCAYALRLIKALRHQYPEVEATFLYMDIQPAGASFQPFLDSCRNDKGIRLIRSLSSKIYNVPGTDGLKVRLTDPQRDEVVEETFDLIVLSVGMVPRKGTKTLLDFFDLALTEDGFIASPSPRTGIFVTGAGTGPKDIDRSILQAKSTAFQVQQYLE
jgi:heterodisulfide reductase subunit A